MKKFIASLILLIVIIGITPTISTAAAKDDSSLIRIRGTVRFIASLNTYGIMDFDGKRYHPARKLSRDFQHDGIEVIVEARLRPDLFGSKMYGSAIEVKNIAKLSAFVAEDERDAIQLLLARMNAFNQKDLQQLKKIDTVAKGLTEEQFSTWTSGFGNYTLHYVELAGPGTVRLPASRIEGVCLYSRERVNSIALFGNNAEYAVIRFTLDKQDGEWKFTATAPYHPEEGTSINDVIKNFLDMTQQRYGTTDLSKWKG